jgi:HEAT repeat protein
MKNAIRPFIFSLATLALVILASYSSSAAPSKSEADLIYMLKSPNYKDVIDALDRLPKWYPYSTNAVAVIKEILVLRAPVYSPYEPKNIVTRKAARALGNYHATLTPDELKVIYELFMAPHDPDSIMDGLKALRGMHAPEAVPQILPMLRDPNTHVVRDACRTLAVLGNRDIIPYIQPLLAHPAGDVRADAKDAIAKLQVKP